MSRQDKTKLLSIKLGNNFSGTYIQLKYRQLNFIKSTSAEQIRQEIKMKSLVLTSFGISH